MFTKAIVRPPAPNFANGLTTAGLGAPDYDLALRQHQAYCAALEQCGLTVTSLDPDDDHPDSTFVEDTAIVTERCAVLARPGAPSRTEETAKIQSTLSSFFSSIEAIEHPGTLDGGDVCQVEDHFFIGISLRTNEAGAQQLARLLARFSYSSTSIDIRPGRYDMGSVPGAVATGCGIDMLHLKSGIAYLGDNRLVVTDALAARDEFRSFERIPIDDDEAYGANCVRVNEHVLIAAGHHAFAAKLKDLEYEMITLDMSEFQKMDGGLSCLSLRF